MRNIVKHLLLPVTIVLWYLIAYYFSYYSYYGSYWFIQLSWFWILLIMFVFGSGIVTLFGSLGNIGGFLYYFFDKLYKSSWVSIVLHSLAGLFGVLNAIYLFFFVKGEGETTWLIGSLWEYSVIRTIFFLSIVIPALITTIYASVLLPIILGKNKHYELQSDELY